MLPLITYGFCDIMFQNIILFQAEKDRLEGDVSRLEEELSIISVASRTLTACTVIPIIGILKTTILKLYHK